MSRTYLSANPEFAADSRATAEALSVRPQGPRENVDGISFGIRQSVRISGQQHRGRVPEDARHHDGSDAALEQQSRDRVPHVMETNARQPRRLCDPLEHIPVDIGHDRTPDRVDHNKPLRIALGRERDVTSTLRGSGLKEALRRASHTALVSYAPASCHPLAVHSTHDADRR